MNGSGRSAPPPRQQPSGGLINEVSSFGNDLAALASLQSKLAAADAKDCMRKAGPAMGGLAFALLLAFAAAVVALGGVALWVAESFKMTAPAALMLTGVGTLVVVALLAVVCIRLLTSSLTSFRRSTEELERNIAWVKTTLTQSGR